MVPIYVSSCLTHSTSHCPFRSSWQSFAEGTWLSVPRISSLWPLNKGCLLSAGSSECGLLNHHTRLGRNRHPYPTHALQGHESGGGTRHELE